MQYIGMLYGLGIRVVAEILGFRVWGLDFRVHLSSYMAAMRIPALYMLRHKPWIARSAISR